MAGSSDEGVQKLYHQVFIAAGGCSWCFEEAALFNIGRIMFIFRVMERWEG